MHYLVVQYLHFNTQFHRMCIETKFNKVLKSFRTLYPEPPRLLRNMAYSYNAVYAATYELNISDLCTSATLSMCRC